MLFTTLHTERTINEKTCYKHNNTWLEMTSLHSSVLVHVFLHPINDWKNIKRDIFNVELGHEEAVKGCVCVWCWRWLWLWDPQKKLMRWFKETPQRPVTFQLFACRDTQTPKSCVRTSPSWPGFVCTENNTSQRVLHRKAKVWHSRKLLCGKSDIRARSPEPHTQTVHTYLDTRGLYRTKG